MTTFQYVGSVTSEIDGCNKVDIWQQFNGASCYQQLSAPRTWLCTIVRPVVMSRNESTDLSERFTCQNTNENDQIHSGDNGDRED